MWQVIGCSVTGASHNRSDLPNQDAINWEIDKQNNFIVISLSDGHGSKKSIRSDIGAKKAVEISVNELLHLARKNIDNTSLSTVKNLAENWLSQRIVRYWRESIEQHFNENPLNENENIVINSIEDKTIKERISKDISILYGATLISVLITPSYIVYLQNGDGDILTLFEDSQVFRPLKSDPKLFANETTSLCLPNAWEDFRVYFQVVSFSPPSLIMLSTDGYSNSFVEEEDFFKVIRDIYKLIKQNGVDFINVNIENWLRTVSENGSGDDITVGFAYLPS